MNVVVTAGGTRSPIDDVRHIANVSTGRFGAAIAEAALRRGASVWYVHAPSALRPFDRLSQFDLDTRDPAAEHDRLGRLRDEWRAAVDRYHPIPLRTGTVTEYAGRLEAVLRGQSIDVAFLAMAASDFAPEPIQGKIPSDAETLTLRCRRLPKVIRSVRDWSPSIYLVGFKLLSQAPHSELIRQARAGCLVNRADLTVANDLSSLRAGAHTIHLVRAEQPTETLGPDPLMAELLVDRVWEWAANRVGTQIRD